MERVYSNSNNKSKVQQVLLHIVLSANLTSVFPIEQFFFFFLGKKLILLFSTDALNWSNVKAKCEIYCYKNNILLQNISISNKCCLFEPSKNPIFFFRFFRFLNDNVTLKTGVMMLKIWLCIIGLNYILKYIKIDFFQNFKKQKSLIGSINVKHSSSYRWMDEQTNKKY